MSNDWELMIMLKHNQHNQITFYLFIWWL